MSSTERAGDRPGRGLLTEPPAEDATVEAPDEETPDEETRVEEAPAGEPAEVSTDDDDVDEDEDEDEGGADLDDEEELDDDLDDDLDEEDEPTGAARRFRRLRRVVGWARPLRSPLVIAVVLVLVGAGLTVQTRRLHDDPSYANRALTDTDATARVVGDVSNGLGKIFSYAPGSTAVTERAAANVLAGKARKQYTTLFATVKRQTAEQRVTLKTHVVRAGVTELSGDTAHLLVFMNQVTERKGKPFGKPVAAQLSVTAQRLDGHWKIVGIKAR